MTNNENFPTAQDTKEFDIPLHGHNNVLDLDGRRLQEVASSINQDGISLAELKDIGGRVLDQDNPLLAQFMFGVNGLIDREGGDSWSFRRGAVLALHLVDRSADKGAPRLGVESSRVAAHYSNQPANLEDLRVASDGLLSTQVMLNGAFDEALRGMPESTKRSMARFGAGITALCLMASCNSEEGGKK